MTMTECNSCGHECHCANGECHECNCDTCDCGNVNDAGC